MQALEFQPEGEDVQSSAPLHRNMRRKKHHIEEQKQKPLLGTSASLVVTSALLVTRSKLEFY